MCTVICRTENDNAPHGHGNGHGYENGPPTSAFWSNAADTEHGGRVPGTGTTVKHLFLHQTVNRDAKSTSTYSTI